ncbi:hypothetical protein FNF27_06564 [Cafeteria roenbergensis]|uniref:Glutamine cyclotransferase n=1 Tax=Cafeteria roenbergensis TaxID=33653 RepID=A0A5A8E6B3_CAFRO|nr:hypothetical protein FNF27_06564 [Cafeteria roenbergensis]KAA0171461.1 hypothetical protein FNF28_00673 [Cafeteria roenbergensis]
MARRKRGARSREGATPRGDRVASASGAPKGQDGPAQPSATAQSSAEHSAPPAVGPRILAAAIVVVIAVAIALLATWAPSQTAGEQTPAAAPSASVVDSAPLPSPSAVAPPGNASLSLREQLQYRGHELTGEYSIVRSFPHDSNAFTQGLAMFEGRLFESTGLYGHSSVRELDPQTGAVLRSIRMSDAVFGEGMAVMEQGLAKVLTWRARQAFEYNVSTMRPVSQQSFQSESGEGWGLAYDGDDLLLTDGSDRLQRVDRRTMRPITSTLVHGSSGRVRLLNEAEWVLGEVLANVWFEDYIVRIDPGTGRVLGTLDMTRVGIPARRADGNNVLNGIACDPATFADDGGVRCFVTGKQWDRMHEVRLLTQPRAAGGASL